MSIQALAYLADTTEADVPPLVRDFVINALESRGNNALVDPGTDETLTRIQVRDVSGNRRIEVRTDDGEQVLFTLTIDFPEA